MALFSPITLSPLRPRRPTRTAQGFTLLEVLFATILISLIMSGVVDLFISASKLTIRASAIASTGLSSANAVQQILKDTREAQSLSLPDDTTFKPLTGYTNIGSSYKTIVNGQTILTALEINVPAPQGTTITVVDNSGGARTPVVYDRDTASGDYILFYRGNADQTPNPATGKYLWRYQHNANTASIVCRNIATASGDAVQFLQPTGGSTQVAVKIVSSEYSLINGQQTNEESDGSTTSSLTGKCVLMRDYGNNNKASSAQDQGVCNHAFQHN